MNELVGVSSRKELGASAAMRVIPASRRRRKPVSGDDEVAGKPARRLDYDRAHAVACNPLAGVEGVCARHCCVLVAIDDRVPARSAYASTAERWRFSESLSSPTLAALDVR